MRSEHYKSNRFYILTVFHSFTDIGSSLAYVLFIFTTMTSSSSGVFCIFNLGIAMGMTICSLYQTVLICIHQLVSIFGKNYTFFNRLCSTTAICIAYALICAYSLGAYFAYGNIDTNTCSHSESVSETEAVLILWIYIPVMTLTVVISFTYLTVLWKIKRLHNQVLNNTTANRLKHYAITLGAVIAVSFLAILPSCIYSMFILCHPVVVTYNLRKYTNAMYMIKPILDPVIYIFRIRKDFCCACCTSCSGSTVVQIALAEYNNTGN